MERWRGRVALITGCSVGIGAAVAKHLAALGINVVGCARNLEKVSVFNVFTTLFTLFCFHFGS